MGGLIVLCYLVYKQIMYHRTFYSLNRWLLLSSLILFFYLPTKTIPSEWSINEMFGFQEILNSDIDQNELIIDNVVPSKIDEENFSSISSENFIKVKLSHIKIDLYSIFRWDKGSWLLLLKYIYLLGFFFFSIAWFYQFMKLLFKIYRCKIITDGSSRIVLVEDDISPHSFLNYIFINPFKYDPETFQQILAHEKIHVSQGHSLDLILAEVLLVFQWYNPFCWYYRKAIINNLEFLTDNKLLADGVNRESYQINLLKVAAPQYSNFFANNYNRSMVAKRISKMNSGLSSNKSRWKYLALIPLLCLYVICFNPTYSQPELESKKHIDLLNDISPDSKIETTTKKVANSEKSTSSNGILDLEIEDQNTVSSINDDPKVYFFMDTKCDSCTISSRSDKPSKYFVTNDLILESKLSSYPEIVSKFKQQIWDELGEKEHLNRIAFRNYTNLEDAENYRSFQLGRMPNKGYEVIKLNFQLDEK